MAEWTPERRLALLADILARKRAESMGRAGPCVLNYESMFVIAVAPDHVLDAGDDGDGTSDMEADARRHDVPERTAAEHFEALCADIREFFPDGTPEWAELKS